MSGGTVLLESEQLLRTEALVVNLAGGLNKILEMGTCEEVPEVDEFAVVLVLHVDHAPPVLTTSHLATVHGDRSLRADNRERNEVLQKY